MKKRILILLLFCAGLTGWAQWTMFSDCVNLNDLSSVDSSFYYNTFVARTERYVDRWNFIVRDEAVTSDSLFITLGAGNDRNACLGLSLPTGWPYELGTDSILQNGVYVSGKGTYSDIFPFKVLMIKVYKEASTVQTVATDSICWKLLMFEE